MSNLDEISASDIQSITLVEKLLEQNRTLALIGMMGAGKSTIARQLSAVLGLQYNDTDFLIEQDLGMTITDYFEKFGEPAFRKEENRIISAQLKGGAGILAVGGGSFITPSTQAILLKQADCIFLDVPAKILWSRVKKRLSKRPMLACNNPEKRFHELYRERKPIYQLAPFRIQWQDEHLMATIQRIKKLINNQILSEKP